LPSENESQDCLFESALENLQDPNKQCDASVCTANGWDNSKCTTCGGENQACCSGSTCNSGLYCCSDGKCHQCCSDANCPANDQNVKGKCDTSGSVTGTPYTCYWYPCGSDSDCVSGTYCYCGNCSSSFTSSGCDSNQCCNRGYGGSGIGKCVPAGTTYSNYLCVS